MGTIRVITLFYNNNNVEVLKASKSLLWVSFKNSNLNMANTSLTVVQKDQMNKMVINECEQTDSFSFWCQIKYFHEQANLW